MRTRVTSRAVLDCYGRLDLFIEDSIPLTIKALINLLAAGDDQSRVL